jgi:hypothetical protein
MKSKNMMRFKSRARIIKAIVYAKRIFIVIEMRNGKKHLHELSQITGPDISHFQTDYQVESHSSLLHDGVDQR